MKTGIIGILLANEQVRLQTSASSQTFEKYAVTDYSEANEDNAGSQWALASELTNTYMPCSTVIEPRIITQ